MSSRAGSTFVTFLVSIPVAAMGLMAVFGVPPLATVIAASRGLSDSVRDLDKDGRSPQHSSQNQFEDWDSGTAPDWQSEATDISPIDGEEGAGERGDVDDLGFSKVPRAEDNPRSSRTLPDRKFDSRDRTLESIDQNRPKAESRPLLLSRNSQPNRHFEFGINSNSDPDTQPATTMKESLKKLNTLGVKHYHLERGANADTWLFVCLFVPGDDARVTHRFESESDDPDRAAAETVKQIDDWLLKRFRDKQPISQNAL